MQKREHSIIRKVFTRSLIVYILNNFTWSIGVLVDGAVIGNFFGVDAVAAYGLVWPLTMAFVLVGSIFAGGSRNLYTKLAGQGETREANQVFTLACLVSVVLSLGMAVLAFVLRSPLAVLLGAHGKNAALHPLTCSYLAGILLGLPFDNFAKVVSGYLGIDSDHRTIVAASVAMTVTDILGDLTVVILFPGSLFGLGAATALGQVVYLAVLLTHFLRRDRMLHFTLRGMTGIGEKLKFMVASGLPACVIRVSSTVCGILVNRMLSAAAASSYIAAYSVHCSVTSLVGSTYLGVSDTVWTMSSIYYGEEDRKALRQLQNTSMTIGLVTTGLVSVVLALFPRVFAGIYVGRSDPETLALAAEAVKVFAFSTPLYLLVYTFNGYLMGTEKLHAANIYSFFMKCGAVVPTVWLMLRLMGGRGVWFAIPVSLAVMLLVTVIYILCWDFGDSFSIKRLLLKENFGSKDGEAELNISADTMLEVIGMSRLAGLFCAEQGIDQKRANILALCIEEMGGNIMEHGFSDGKPHMIDMRILVKDGELILRLRDDCRPFNPVERYRMASQQEDDPTRNVGIRMVMKMSRDVKYLSTMSTNNLIIRI